MGKTTDNNQRTIHMGAILMVLMLANACGGQAEEPAAVTVTVTGEARMIVGPTPLDPWGSASVATVADSLGDHQHIPDFVQFSSSSSAEAEIETATASAYTYGDLGTGSEPAALYADVSVNPPSGVGAGADAWAFQFWDLVGPGPVRQAGTGRVRHDKAGLGKAGMASNGTERRVGVG